MEFSNDQHTLTIELCTRIDTSNAASVEEEINKILCDNAYENLVLDASKLEYISSAGLRAILKVRKVNPSLKIIECCNDVFDIFEMTGFSQMMEVSKAFKKMSIEGCPIIGKGGVGTVYRTGSDEIVKVYAPKTNFSDIQREKELAKQAFVLGIPTAISFEIVKVGDQYGARFELLDAKTLLDCIKDDPDNIDTYLSRYVDVLKSIHGSIAPASADIPDAKARAIVWCDFLKDYLPQPEWQILDKYIKEIPASDNLIHGDFHVKNILVQNNEPFIIDMDTLSKGNPIFEIALLYASYHAYSEIDLDNPMRFFGVEKKVTDYIFDKTIKLYFATEDASAIDAIVKKARIIAYTQLIRRNIRHNESVEEKELFTKELCELIHEVDNLYI